MRPTLVLALAIALTLSAAPAASAQAPTFGSTLRYGSGLLDVPVASVLPHLGVRAGYSGFWTDVDRSVLVNDSGDEAGFAPGGRVYHEDGSFSLGLFDRGEMGVSIQSLGSPDSGGDMWGIFGRINLLQPRGQGIGVAVGGRYLTRQDFGDGITRASGRLGFPDARLVRRFEGSDKPMRTRLSLYGVATAQLRGFDASRIPENDIVLSLGWGGGMFRGSSGADFYGDGSNGWFMGASSHWRLGDDAVLLLMAEHNGFDVNVGMRADVSGASVGVHLLGANHSRPAGGYSSEYRSPKLGVSVSLAVCPDAPGLRCRSRLMERVEPDTIRIPPPPPDTVIVDASASAEPEGEPAAVCLSTGQSAPIRITAAGDTLVGSTGTPISELRPIVDFAGRYADGEIWYERRDDIQFEGDRFVPVGGPFDITCGEILRVGAYQGIPLFADRDAIRPLEAVFVPVRIGVWQRYERPQELQEAGRSGAARGVPETGETRARRFLMGVAQGIVILRSRKKRSSRSTS
jgi:hypothetical protein